MKTPLWESVEPYGMAVLTYFAMALDFIAERVGKQNILSAVVHMDEKTPHMHLCFVPITPEGKLSAKYFLGNQKSLSEWQTA